jgi:hypothetical protein
VQAVGPRTFSRR